MTDIGQMIQLLSCSSFFLKLLREKEMFVSVKDLPSMGYFKMFFALQDGRVSQLEHVFIRGSKVRYIKSLIPIACFLAVSW